jgi:histidyl-tRNA synthetase
LLRQIGFERFTIRVNNRLVLAGLLESVGLADRSTDVLRAIDKLAKVGAAKVCEELEHVAGATSEQARHVVDFAEISGTTDEMLEHLRALLGKSERGREGIERLTQLMAAVAAAGVPAERVRLDVAIARGLDYYTGTVFETTLDDLPDIGSIASGGRYDNLAELYTNQELPGIGASLGLDRLLAAMEELKMIAPIRTPAQVLIAYFDANHLGDYLRVAAELRSAGLAVEVYPDPVKLGKQLQYADRRGHRVAIVAGEREFAAGECQVKNLGSGDSTAASLENGAAAVIDAIRRILAS